MKFIDVNVRSRSKIYAKLDTLDIVANERLPTLDEIVLASPYQYQDPLTAIPSIKLSQNDRCNPDITLNVINGEVMRLFTFRPIFH